MFAPAGTARPVIERVNGAVAKAYASAELKQKIESLGSEPATSTPAELAERVKRDTAGWGKTIRQAGIKVN
jgi:tripartite-type tricarboxylate transporter receptor subunit TctC